MPSKEATQALEYVLESRVWETVINALPPLEMVVREELGESYTEPELLIAGISKP